MVASSSPASALRPRNARLRAIALWGIAVLATACASAGDGTARELDKLRQELSGLRAQTGALTERMQALELAGARSGAGAEVEAIGATDPSVPHGRPALPVVRMSPELRPAEDATYVASVDAAPEGRVQLRSTPNGIVQEDLKADGSTAPRSNQADRGRPKPKPDGARAPSLSTSHP